MTFFLDLPFAAFGIWSDSFGYAVTRRDSNAESFGRRRVRDSRFVADRVLPLRIRREMRTKSNTWQHNRHVLWPTNRAQRAGRRLWNAVPCSQWELTVFSPVCCLMARHFQQIGVRKEIDTTNREHSGSHEWTIIIRPRATYWYFVNLFVYFFLYTGSSSRV